MKVSSKVGFLDPNGEEGYDLSKRTEMEKLELSSHVFPIVFLLKINADFISKYSKMDPSKKEQLTPQGSIGIFF